MNARIVKPIKHDLSCRSSVFTPVSPISKTEIISGKILSDTGYYLIEEFYRIAEFYRIPDTGIWILYIPTAFTYRRHHGTTNTFLNSTYLQYNSKHHK